MLFVLRSSWALFLGIALLMIGNSMQGTLLGIRGGIEGFDPTVMGYVMSAYFVGFLGGSMATTHMIRNVGHVRVFAALGSFVSAAFIIYATFVDPIWWAVMRFIVGFCFAGVYIVAESWLNNSATNENRGQVLSTYMIVQLGGVVLGQALINAADPGGFELFVLMSVVVSISFAPILLSAAPAPVYDSNDRMSILELFRASPLGCVGSLLLGGVFSAMFGMSAVYAGEIGLSVVMVSYFVMAIYIGGLILQYPIGWLSDHMDRRVLIIGATIIGAVACLGGMIFGNSLMAVFAAGALLGGVANPLYGLLIAYTNDFLPTSKMAAASSGLVFLNGMGASFGPIVVGYLMNAVGPSGFFAYNAILLALVAAYGIYRMTQRAAPTPDETSSYAPMPIRGTAVAAELSADYYAEEVGEDPALAANEGMQRP